MSSMSYCRFHNTKGDLQDCLDALSDLSSLEELSADLERPAAAKLRQIAEEFIEIYDSLDCHNKNTKKGK